MRFEFRLEDDFSKNWNQNLTKSELGNIFNTIEYSKYAKNRLGWKPQFLTIIDPKGKLVGQSILFEYSTRKFGKNFNRMINKFSIKIPKKLRWTYGPIIFSNEKNIIFNEFLEFIHKTKNNVNGNTHPLLSLKFEKSPLEISHWSTFLIDLKQSEENLLSKMDKKSVRKNIERSEERGVTVHEINEKSLMDYHEILNKSREELKNSTYNFEDTKKLWDLLKPLGFNGFIAKKDDKITGGITFSSFNNYINEWGVARTKKDTDERLYSQDLLKWKIIQWGKKFGNNFYDLSGANPEPQTEKEKGILRYKKKWGGTMKKYLIIGNKK